MLQSIMVPLDRSSFAEQALPLALSIAELAKARLDLVHVHALYGMDDPTSGWLPYEPAMDTDQKRQEQQYLEDTARQLASISSVAIHSAVLPGSSVLPETVADSLIKRAQVDRADLIVLATHAPGLLGQFLIGSVGDELIRRSPAPVLLVRPGVGPPARSILEEILVPLDGSPLAELALGPAIKLARLVQSKITLLRAVGSANEKDHAEEYLEGLARGVREQALAARVRAVVAADGVQAILEEAEGHKAGLIALASHGRGGLSRLLFGSVADQVVRGTKSAVLVTRPASP
jgi:nucleotide-binding universal stress UspA family protein